MAALGLGIAEVARGLHVEMVDQSSILYAGGSRGAGAWWAH
jgi:hypothetical protein